MTGRRRALFLVSTAGVLAAVTAFGYLGGFLAPDADARGLPIAVVNLDRGAEVGTRSVRFGDQVLEQLHAPDPRLGDTVSWQDVPSRDEARDRVRQDRAYAALVIPRDFSSRLAAMVTAGATNVASIEVLTNPASGSFSGAYSQAVATAAVDQVSRESAVQLAETLEALGLTVEPASALTIGRPVEATITIAHPVGERGGRGLAPFYFAVVIVVASLFATSTLNIVVDVAAGHQKLAVLGHPVGFGRIPDRGPERLLWAKVRLVVPVAVAVGSVVSIVALGPLGMTVDRPLLLTGFAVLGAAATAAITLALYTAFDLAGSVLAALFLVIYGVPASAGVYPVQALPSFFRVLHTWLPLRHLSDGVRALTFGGGPPNVIPRAASVLIVYTVVGIGAAVGAARYTARRTASTGATAPIRHPVQGFPDGSPAPRSTG